MLFLASRAQVPTLPGHHHLPVAAQDGVMGSPEMSCLAFSYSPEPRLIPGDAPGRRALVCCLGQLASPTSSGWYEGGSKAKLARVAQCPHRGKLAPQTVSCVCP